MLKNIRSALYGTFGGILSEGTRGFLKSLRICSLCLTRWTRHNWWQANRILKQELCRSVTGTLPGRPSGKCSYMAFFPREGSGNMYVATSFWKTHIQCDPPSGYSPISSAPTTGEDSTRLRISPYADDGRFFIRFNMSLMDGSVLYRKGLSTSTVNA